MKLIFDDKNSKRNNISQPPYYDAKPSGIDLDNPFGDLKSDNSMFDFERAKQKFDNNARSKSQLSNSKSNSSSSKHSNSVSGIPKRNTSYHDNTNLHLNLNENAMLTKQNINDTIQFFDENYRNSKGGGSKRNSKTNSINLDGLKISEDDEVSGSV